MTPSDWTKRVQIAAEKFVNEEIAYSGLEYPLSGTTVKECTKSFTAGANFARDKMINESAPKLFANHFVRRDMANSRIQALQTQAERLAEVLEHYETCHYCSACGVADVRGEPAREALAAYLKFKERGE